MYLFSHRPHISNMSEPAANNSVSCGVDLNCEGEKAGESSAPGKTSLLKTSFPAQFMLLISRK